MTIVVAARELNLARFLKPRDRIVSGEAAKPAIFLSPSWSPTNATVQGLSTTLVHSFWLSRKLR